jgi:hypothetical protein
VRRRQQGPRIDGAHVAEERGVEGHLARDEHRPAERQRQRPAAQQHGPPCRQRPSCPRDSSEKPCAKPRHPDQVERGAVVAESRDPAENGWRKRGREEPQRVEIFRIRACGDPADQRREHDRDAQEPREVGMERKQHQDDQQHGERRRGLADPLEMLGH